MIADTGQPYGIMDARANSDDCRGYDSCWASWVVMSDDCPRSLYAELTIYDANGGNIGWTNDTAQGVRAGERVKLVFGTYERGARGGRVTELNCY